MFERLGAWVFDEPTSDLKGMSRLILVIVTIFALAVSCIMLLLIAPWWVSSILSLTAVYYWVRWTLKP